MLKVRDLMTSDLVTTTPSETLRDAAEAMAYDHVSGLPVVEGGKAVGVISATDILSFTADAAGVEMERPVAPGARDIPSGAQWEEGAEVPFGYYADDWRDEEFPVGEYLPSADRPEWNVMEETTVAEVMTRSVQSVPADSDVQEAARAMLDAGIRRLLVVEDGRLVGVVSSTDVMKAVAELGLGNADA